MTRRLLAPLAAAVLVLGIAACGPDEPEPRNTDLIDLGNDEASDGGGEGPSDGGGESPSDGGGDHSEATSESAATPVIPEPDPADYPNMGQNDSDGAKDAFRYYMALTMWARQTGDSSLHAKMENDTCEGCVLFDDEVEELRERGETWTEVVISEYSVESFEDSNYDFDVRFTFHVESHKRPGESAGEALEAPPLQYIAAGAMEWVDGAWRIAGLKVDWTDEF